VTTLARDILTDLSGVPRHAREEAVLARRDLWVEWPLVDVVTWSVEHTVVFRVTSDVFALGSTEQPIRVPLSAPIAQEVADALGFQLITSRMSDFVWKQSSVKLDPIPWGAPYDDSMLSVERIIIHNDRIEAQRRGRSGLVAGHKKDVVISNRLASQPRQVAIYGWHGHDGKAIQPLSLVHEASYADYSHGARFASAECTVDGEPRRLADVMTDPELCTLVSAEGPMRVARYP
jgi:hypothetical protein